MPAVPRATETQGSGAPLSLYVLAGTVGGAATGAAVSGFGAVVDASLRAVVAPLGTVFLLLGTLELARGRISLLQRDRETSRAWTRNSTGWALKQGLTLGSGIATRLGFALWYALPALVLLSRSIVIGSALWASYGFVRTGAAVLLRRTGGNMRTGAVWLAKRLAPARRATSLVLVALGAGMVWAQIG